METKKYGTNVPATEKTITDSELVTKESGTNVPELPDSFAVLEKLLTLGASQRSVAKFFGVSHTTIQRYAKMIREIREGEKIIRDHEKARDSL